MAPEFGDESEPRDYTKWVWGGVLIAIVAMVAALWAAGRPDAGHSQVHARHILVKFKSSDEADRARALELITEVRKKLDAGEKFATLAREFSDDPGSASHGGDLGYAERGIYAAAFDKYCWSAPIKQISDVIQTEHGFHIIQVLDRRIGSADKYEEELEERARKLKDGEKKPDTAQAPAPAK